MTIWNHQKNVGTFQFRVLWLAYTCCYKSLTKERVIHCSQLLYKIWELWKHPEVVINYFNNDGGKVCRLNTKGSVCEAIFKGEKDISYLAERFKKNDFPKKKFI